MEPSEFREIRYEVRGEAAIITLHRPEQLNAFTPRMAAELMAAFDLTDADDEVRGVVVTGAGRAFCAGADLSLGGDTFDLTEAAAAGGRGVAGNGMVHDGDRSVPADLGGVVVLRIHRSRKPVIAAINGSAVGVGLTMTLPMDIRLVADNAKLGFVFVRRGITPDGCATWFLPRLVGIGTAQDWVLTGRHFTPTEAYAAGLVTEVLPAIDPSLVDGSMADDVIGTGGVLDVALAIVDEIAEHTAPVSASLSRGLMWQGLMAETPEDAHRAESFALWGRGRSADVREGVTAFIERREVDFPDRVGTSDEIAEVWERDTGGRRTR